jgi:hypothetical protein
VSQHRFAAQVLPLLWDFAPGAKATPGGSDDDGAGHFCVLWLGDCLGDALCKGNRVL